ncbi:hypothetical protein JHK85_000870 [Glycine max]|nr:hypothetical protein JHK85_000870 [Glycine max]
MNQRSPLDVNVAYVEGRDEADKGTSNTQDFFTRPSGKRTRNDLTSQYNAGGYIPQQDGAGQDGAGDAAHGVFEIETLVRVRVTLSCEWQTIGKYEVALISVDFSIEWVFEVENMKLYTLQSHTSSSLHFSNSDHAIGVGLIAFSVEMTNKAKGKGKEVAGKGFAGKRKGAFDDDKTDGGRKRNK